jgi:hypothetical protein
VIITCSVPLKNMAGLEPTARAHCGPTSFNTPAVLATSFHTRTVLATLLDTPLMLATSSSIR